jgi:hypothetical protein
MSSIPVTAGAGAAEVPLFLNGVRSLSVSSSFALEIIALAMVLLPSPLGPYFMLRFPFVICRSARSIELQFSTITL